MLNGRPIANAKATLLCECSVSKGARVRRAAANIIKASAGEASMMARCTGKTNLHNFEPEAHLI